VTYEAETGFVRFVQNGTISEEDARDIVARYASLTVDDALFILGDHRHATNTTAGARKMFTQHDQPVDVYYAAYGASFAFRVVITLILKAMSVVPPRIAGSILVDEAEARAWLTDKKRDHFARRAKR